MADVTPLRPPDDGGARRRARDGNRDRGQLVLVGALALAVLFVTLALLLNTAIYTGNLATRATAGDSGAVLEYRGSVVETTERSIARANGTNSTYDELHAAVRDDVAAWNDAASHHRAVAGADADARVDATTNGTRLTQSSTREFTNASEESNWTVTADTTAYRGFSMNVENDTLADVSGLETNVSEFTDAGVLTVRLTTTDGEDEYVAFVGRDGENVSVTAFRPSGNLTCSAESGGNTVAVDFSNGSVGGESCEGLVFLDDVSESFELAIEDGDAGNGTYSLVTDRRYSHYDGGGHFADAGSSENPTRHRALYGANVSLTYWSPGTQYAATVEVTPDAA